MIYYKKKTLRANNSQNRDPLFVFQVSFIPGNKKTQDYPLSMSSLILMLRVITIRIYKRAYHVKHDLSDLISNFLRISRGDLFKTKKGYL